MKFDIKIKTMTGEGGPSGIVFICHVQFPVQFSPCIVVES